jgi:hypothetical protein
VHRPELREGSGVLPSKWTDAFKERTFRGWQKEWYQVFRFAEEAHAETFMKEFGGERMHPSERGKGKRWSMWKKGSQSPEARR